MIGASYLVPAPEMHVLIFDLFLRSESNSFIHGVQSLNKQSSDCSLVLVAKKSETVISKNLLFKLT